VFAFMICYSLDVCVCDDDPFVFSSVIYYLFIFIIVTISLVCLYEMRSYYDRYLILNLYFFTRHAWHGMSSEVPPRLFRHKFVVPFFTSCVSVPISKPET